MSAPAPLPSAVAVLEKDGSLVTADGITLLSSLPAQARVRQQDAAVLVGIAAGSPTSCYDFALGKLNANRFLALGRTSLWWMSPKWGSRAEEVPEETQFLLAELPRGGGYALLLPLIDGGAFRTTLRGPSPKDGDRLMARIESGAAGVTASAWVAAVLVAAGLDPYELIARGVAAAARLSGPARPRKDKAVPESADCFGWCTWDAMYSRVSPAAIQAGLRSLAAGGTAPKFLIIDDAASTHTAAGGVGMGSAVAEVEQEAMAAAAAEEIQPATSSDEAEAATASQAVTSNSAGSSSSSSSLLAVLAAWARAACGKVAAAAAGLEAAVFSYCRKLLEGTPAGHWRMRLFSALAASPLVRPALLRYYASASDHTRRLVSVRANGKFSRPETGPDHPFNSGGDDLASVVAALKQRHGLRFVWAWHSMFGYWGGLGLKDEEMQKYAPKLVLPRPTPGMLAADPAVAWVQPVLSGVALPADPSALHEDMHAYLAACGIDGVKVDVQSTTGLCGSGAGQPGGPALAAAFHASLEASIGRHFPGNQAINCMSHSTEDLYCFSHTNLARVSDDFYPRNPASWTTHIASCAYNSLFMGEIVVPDWDMFQSEHEKRLLHATARAVSGGPVYVSDSPGRHDHALLRRLVLPDGSVLRCELPGRPTRDCLFADVCCDGTTALKVWNMNAVTGVVAVFNVQGSAWSRELRRFDTHDQQPPALTATVRPCELLPLAASGAELFAAYVDSTQRLALLAPEQGLEVAVSGGGGSEVVCLSPVREAGGVAFAPLGLPGMLNAGGAVVACQLEGGRSEDGFELQPARTALRLRGAGQVLCYASHRPAAVSIGGQEVAFSYDEAAAALRFNLPAGNAASEAKAVAIQFCSDAPLAGRSAPAG